MCHPPGARPPDVPADLLPISGGAGGEDVILTSEDATRFRAHLAKAGEGDGGVVIAPDVREYFPDSDTVNEALRTLIGLIPRKRGAARAK